MCGNLGDKQWDIYGHDSKKIDPEFLLFLKLMLADKLLNLLRAVLRLQSKDNCREFLSNNHTVHIYLRTKLLNLNVHVNLFI